MRLEQMGRVFLQVAGNFCRNVFLPDWYSAWEQVCAETGAEVTPPFLWRFPRILFRHRGFEISVANISSEGHC
jgi:hypothetical protein